MYICHDCENSSTIKLGKCPYCWSFGTYIKDPRKTSKTSKKNIRNEDKWEQLKVGKKEISQWFNIDHKELLRIFSSWIKWGGLYLLAWEPWIWKSTLMLQILAYIKEKNLCSIAYFSWEEDSSQIYERQKRISTSDKVIFDIFQAHHLEDITSTASEKKYDIIVIDSIQTVYTPHHDSVAWSISQIKRCSEKISERCKAHWVTCFLIGHVTKWWEIAWPRYLEHIVDVVLYLEWDRYGQYRFLRTKKNRFWASDEVGIFEMKKSWLSPVYDLKERIINQTIQAPWNVLTVWIDSWRPVLVNIEALLVKSNGKFPQRVTMWMDNKRVQIIIAIIERYMKVPLWATDIYLNIPWEFQFRDTWLDLAIAMAIYSQAKWITIDKKLIFIGELGLSWQILYSKHHDKRKKEISEFTCIDFTRIKNISEIKSIL